MQEIETRCVIEIVGSPKEHVEEVINKIVEKVKKEYKVIQNSIFEAKQIDKFWGGFVELIIKFEKLDNIFGFCFDYMPSSVEIINPNKLEVNNSHINDLLNDMVMRLHQYDMIMKNIKAANTLLQKKLEEKK